jgi:nitroimidazol reductase NimA-like FMN-containing flavoprotein (pyridoxamine 5'-phosphate oxidase superfamily)
VGAQSSRSAVRRHPERGKYDREAIHAIFDEAIFCHVGFAVDGQPFVIPTIHARVDDILYLHGSPASRLLGRLASPVEVCVAATILDGLVLARSVYNHSMNYRSAVVFGRARAVEDRGEKLAALEAVSEHVVRGRWADARGPSEKEFAGTRVLAVEIEEASAKVRSGPPGDFEADVTLPIWAGVIPVHLVAGEPQTDERVPEGVPVPEYALTYDRP